MQNMHITGTHIAYLHICPRKLWLFSHGVQMEHASDTIRMGKQISEETYERERKERDIDGNILLDWMRDDVVHEVKKSNKVEYAHEAQLLYYLWYLEQKGLTGIKGRLDYPLLKKTKEITLDDTHRSLVCNWCQSVEWIVAGQKPPARIGKRICKKCSYYELCYS